MSSVNGWPPSGTQPSLSVTKSSLNPVAPPCPAQSLRPFSHPAAILLPSCGLSSSASRPASLFSLPLPLSLFFVVCFCFKALWISLVLAECVCSRKGTWGVAELAVNPRTATSECPMWDKVLCRLLAPSCGHSACGALFQAVRVEAQAGYELSPVPSTSCALVMKPHSPWRESGVWLSLCCRAGLQRSAWRLLLLEGTVHCRAPLEMETLL